jgi:hypothetical protein
MQKLPPASAPIAHDKGLPYSPENRRSHETTFTSRDYMYKRLVPTIVTLFALFTLFRSAFVSDHHYTPNGQQELLPEINEEVDKPKVELEAHGMSRCPDFKDCLRELILPTMEQVSDRVNFTLSFIGQ